MEKLKEKKFALWIKGIKGDSFGISVKGNIYLNDEIIGCSEDIAQTFLHSLPNPAKELGKKRWHDISTDQRQKAMKKVRAARGKKLKVIHSDDR